MNKQNRVEIYNGLPYEIRLVFSHLDSNTLSTYGIEETSDVEVIEFKDFPEEELTKVGADFAGRPLADMKSLPQEQTFTYPYDDSRPIKQNYNAESVLRRKEFERKMQRIKQFLERTKQ